MCQQKACSCIPCTAGESTLKSSGLLVTVDQTGSSHGQDIKVRGAEHTSSGEGSYCCLL